MEKERQKRHVNLNQKHPLGEDVFFSHCRPQSHRPQSRCLSCRHDRCYSYYRSYSGGCRYFFG